MARKKQEDAPKGSPAWMNTFSDLMNLLLCFFVLLFSMSTVDADKFEKVIASLQSSFSILPSGGSSIGDGEMVSSGVSQLEKFDVFYNEMANSQTEKESESEANIVEAYKQQALEESEQMAEQMEETIAKYGIQDKVEVEFNADFVLLNLNGALLFDSGKAEIRTDALPLMEKIGKVLSPYDQNIIEVEGHTDNVPIHSSRFEDNSVLSMYRAHTVMTYLQEVTSIDPAHLKSSGRGETIPVADNATPSGRARNRRVEIKIYNSYSSNLN